MCVILREICLSESCLTHKIIYGKKKFIFRINKKYLDKLFILITSLSLKSEVDFVWRNGHLHLLKEWIKLIETNGTNIVPLERHKMGYIVML